jgi:DNA-directed RNA polymerase subunit RPC12/RpoP
MTDAFEVGGEWVHAPETDTDTGTGECDPIIVADGGQRCAHCGETFDADTAPTLTIPSATLAKCPECGRYTETDRC